jgi:AcrR family transcriptional regulator
MAGLRQRQKADREQRILTAAAELFREVGYEGAKMEAIAEQAGVSAGTIYNYYQNKGDLLVAIVAMEVNEVLKAGALHISKRHQSAAKAVDKLVAIYIEHSLVYLSKEMWREAMATATRQPYSPFGRIYSGLDERLAEQVCALLNELKRTGLLAAGADTTSTGQLIFNNLNMMFMVFVKAEPMTIAQVLAAIKRQHQIVLAHCAERSSGKIPAWRGETGLA